MSLLSNSITQKAYLKKYLSPEEVKDVKRKKKKVGTKSGTSVIKR